MLDGQQPRGRERRLVFGNLEVTALFLQVFDNIRKHRPVSVKDSYTESMFLFALFAVAK